MITWSKLGRKGWMGISKIHTERHLSQKLRGMGWGEWIGLDGLDWAEAWSFHSTTACVVERCSGPTRRGLTMYACNGRRIMFRVLFCLGQSREMCNSTEEGTEVRVNGLSI